MKEQLIIDFKKGDKTSYRLIFDELYPVMCVFARKFVHNPDDTEDIVQEVFIELWNQRAKFLSFEQMKGFLYLSVKNRCLNFLKHEKIVEKHSSNSFSDVVESFESAVIEAEIVNNLYQIIYALPPRQQQVILHSLQGLKNEEIAEEMRISLNSVKLYKKIAYEYLRNKLSTNIFLLLF